MSFSSQVESQHSPSLSQVSSLCVANASQVTSLKNCDSHSSRVFDSSRNSAAPGYEYVNIHFTI